LRLKEDELSRQAQQLVRQGARRFIGRAAAPLALRLALGEVAGSADRLQFAAAFAGRDVKIPALLRGLLGLAKGREMLHHVAAYVWHERRAAQTGAAFHGPAATQGNIYTAWTGPALGFLHFEKCAGNALLAWLCGHFHPEQIAPAPYRDLPPHLFSRPSSLVDRGRYPLIWGHYDLPGLRHFDAGRRIFTVLREPRARLVSLYHYWRAVNPARIDPDISFAVGLAHRLSLAEFLTHDEPFLTDLIDNMYVRRLTGLYATGAAADPLRADPAAALDQAVAALEGLFFVGIAEALDAAAISLADRLGIARPSRKLRANVTQDNHEDPTGWFRQAETPLLSDADEAALTRRTSLDSELYARFAGRQRHQAG
jgi:hypothetical protein